MEKNKHAIFRWLTSKTWMTEKRLIAASEKKTKEFDIMFTLVLWSLQIEEEQANVKEEMIHDTISVKISIS